MAYKSYARTSQFRPIIIPDTSERDLRQEERDMAQERKAFEYGQENRQRVQNQLEENQRVEQEARDRNFELNDDFIKQNRAAAKRNYETKIRNLEQQSQNSQQLMKFATQMSGTFAQQFSEQMETKREAEKNFAYSLYYKYGVTSEERAALDSGEAQINGMQESLNPVIADLKRRGASVEEIRQMQNLSGYAEYGAKKAMVEKAGGQFSAFVLSDRRKYQVGDRQMTYAEAVAEGDEVAANTILDQMRPQFINEVAPGMDPIFLDKYMFPKMRDWEQTQIGEIRRTATANAKANEKLKQTQLLQGDLDNPDTEMGAQEFIDRFQTTGKGNRGAAMTAQVANLVAAAEVQPQKATQLIKSILGTYVEKSNGQKGTFEQVFPAQAALLKNALNSARKTQNANESARQRQEDLLVERVSRQLLNDLQGKPKAEWEKAIEQFESGKTYGEKRIASLLAQKMDNSTAEAKRDEFWRSQWENDPFLTVETINGTRDASEKLKKEFRKKAISITPETKRYISDAKSVAKYAVKDKAIGVSIVDGSLQDDSAQMALSAAIKEYERVFAGAMKTTGDPEKANDLAIAAMGQFIDKLEWVTDTTNRASGQTDSYFKGYTFGDAAARAKASGNSLSKLQEFKKEVDEQGTDALNSQELIPFNTLKKLLYDYKRTGTLSPAGYRLQFLAEQSPKITIVDVINGQIEYWKGVKGGDTIEGMETLEDAFPPPPELSGPGIDIDYYQRQIIESDYYTAAINTSYKPNPVRSEIARISMGGPVTSYEEAFIQTVRSVEGTLSDDSYNKWFGGRTDMDMTSMTLQEVYDEQTRRLNSGETRYSGYNSAAVGLGQFMNPLEQGRAMYQAKGLPFDPTQILFDEQFQTDLMIDLAKRKRGVDVSKELTLADMQILQNEWAGLGTALGQTTRTAADSLGIYRGIVSKWRQMETLDPDVVREYNKRNGN